MPHKDRRRVIVLLASAVVVGCGNIVGSNTDADLSVSFNSTPATSPAGILTVHLDGPGWHHTVRGLDLRSDPGYSPQVAFGVPAGDLDVSVILQSGGDTIASHVGKLHIEHGYGYGLGLYLGLGDPSTFQWVICIPSVSHTVLRKRLSGVSADTLYLTWSGLPKGAVC